MASIVAYMFGTKLMNELRVRNIIRRKMLMATSQVLCALQVYKEVIL